jgi:hypothetical protein
MSLASLDEVVQPLDRLCCPIYSRALRCARMRLRAATQPAPNSVLGPAVGSASGGLFLSEPGAMPTNLDTALYFEGRAKRARTDEERKRLLAIAKRYRKRTVTADERRLLELLAKSADGCTDTLPAVTYDHHCILSFKGEDWRIAVVCGTLVKLRNARGETIVDVAKMDWPTYQAAALAWDECPDGHIGVPQEVLRKPAA